MSNIGPMELMLVLIIALIVVGPRRLPDLGRSLGSGMRQFRSGLSGREDEQVPPAGVEADADGERVPDAGVESEAGAPR
jgi:sec-independent protein translocase protein TatA